MKANCQAPRQIKQVVVIVLFLICFTSSFAQETAILNWANRIGGSGADRARDMVLDASGNIYISGFFNGTVDFDPGPATFNMTSTVTGTAFAAKYDPNGNFIWAKSYGGPSAVGQAITVDNSGNVYITGGFEATGDFDPGSGVFNMTARTTTESDIYILKLDANGDLVWAKEIDGGTWFDNGYEIKLDAAGNVFVIGRFYYQGGPSFDFDPGPGIFLLTATHEDIFILKLDNNGNFVWAQDIGAPTGADEHRGYSIDIDGAGNLYATGYFEGTVDFDFGAGTTNLTATGDWDVFFMKVDNNGNFVWANKLVNSAPTYYTDGQYGSKIEVDAAGNIYTSGRFNGTSDFDPGAGTFNLTSNGDFDAYLLKMTTDGNFVWAKSWGGSQYDEGFSLTVTSSGIPYVTGSFRSVVDFDPGAGTYNLTSSGGSDVFISKFDTNGNFSWARSMGGPSDDQAYGVVTNSAGDIYVSGSFLGTADFDPSPGSCVYNMTASGEDIFITKLNPVATLSISSTSITSGSVGSTVVITGTGFSSTPANNFVAFNSIVAVVTASTATTITTTVPIGATTGKISVTVNCVAVLSPLDFIVTDNFVTRWNLATTGSGLTQLSFGTATSGTVNYTWQEISPGTASGSGSWSGSPLTITGLPTGATIRLQITPTNFQRIIINTGTDRNRLTRVEQWGTTVWSSMQNAFRGCANLQVTATDLPDLSGLSDLSGMFSLCTTLNSPSNIGSWNTSVVTNMSALFSQASAFNQNISSWNTGAVTNMSSLFADAAAFNQDIGAWNTASVTNMAGMFAGATVFNRSIGTWNTAAVTNMNSMFFSAYAFNQNIGGWNTGAVTNMSSMFGYAYNFNQNIGTWNTSSVTNMSRMFEDAFDFNQNIGTWNTSAVTNMRGMFIDAYAFNQNIGTWNTSAVTDMSRMFDYGTAFNQDIGAWNTASVTNMSGMFADASAFNQNIGTWSLNPGVNLTGMLNNSNMDCNNYSATLIGWSANASTPNGRTLGATGRQYGTNAVAARTNLIAKGWTITGDTPSGAVCSLGSTITIITQPSNFSACFGETPTATFTTNATGTTNITYQWELQKIDFTFDDVVDGGAYSGANTPTLTVNTGVGPVSLAYRCRINGDFASQQVSTTASLVAIFPPPSPTATGASRCDTGSVALNASGGSNGQYRWYAASTGGTNFVGEVNSAYTTPMLNSTTTYYVSINNGTCESTRTPVTATINTAPAKPTITSSITPSANTVSVCSSNVLTLSAPAGFSTYTWSLGGNTQQVTASASGTYSVTLTDAAGCSSVASDMLTVTVIPAPCSNQPPVIASTSAETQIEGKVSLDLVSLITDADGNVDIQSLKIKTQPTSGAKASITASGLLELDYQGISFSGPDVLTIEVCDLLGGCTQQEIKIEVIGDLNIYNGISPNGDGLNDSWVILYIETIAETKENKVSVYNRWGDLVWETDNYDNKDRVFKGLNKSGNEVSSGTYFYKIEFSSGRKAETGYLSLKR